MDISAVILTAKLGGSRKDAQIDTCTVFAAALYDVLQARGIACQLASAYKRGPDGWGHALVCVDGRYYDSLGEFSTAIYRQRAKIHPKVELTLEFQPDTREDCYEPEFDELYAFYVKMLNKAICGVALAKAA